MYDDLKILFLFYRNYNKLINHFILNINNIN